jgi:hypothetical protein
VDTTGTEVVEVTDVNEVLETWSGVAQNEAPAQNSRAATWPVKDFMYMGMDTASPVSGNREITCLGAVPS